MEPGELPSSQRSARVLRQPGRSRLRRAVILAAFTAAIGLTILFSFGYYLEEDSGLELLFHLRGAIHAPPDVVIVSLDSASSDRLGLSSDHANWPRSYHAQLIQRLIAAGASVIAFDVFFSETRSLGDDRTLAKAIATAGNVVLVEDLRKKIIPLVKGSMGSGRNSITVERLIPPIPVLAQAAISFAPFPLPKIPVRVSQYWTFEQTGDVPTFPAVTFQIFALQAYDDFMALMSKAAHDPRVAQSLDSGDRLALVEADRLLGLQRNAIMGAAAVNDIVRSLRKILGGDTLLAGIMREDLSRDEASSSQQERRRNILRALVNMYRPPNSRYLNFYGPPRTITTVPYYQVLQTDQRHVSAGNAVDFKDKAVFVGYSDSAAQNQGDFYNTVFTLPDGRDISGVEIAATAFANLMQDNSVRPVGINVRVLTIVLFGVVSGMICYLLGPLLAALCMFVVSALYLAFASLQFADAAVWYPIITPIGFQMPLAFTAAVLWKYYAARKAEAAHERLRELDRLKTLFLSQVSHELKAPLSSIQGFVENMLDGMTGELQGKQQEYLRRVRENTERLTRMITNLLDLSRIESGTQRVDRVAWRLFDLVEEVVRQFDPIAKRKGLVLELNSLDPALRILADHDKFIQIITNLLDNAIKFTPAGGKVTVSLGRADADHASLTIKDSGEGIPPEAMANLFEPFYQASQGPGIRARGLGLGLSIVKTLIEIHGGSISVTSEPGQGSEFRIVLPLLADAG